MVLARWQRTMVDQLGNILPSCNVEVRREIPGAPLALLYSDRDGANGIANPFTADVITAMAGFHVVGGVYRIRAYLGAFDVTWRYVGIGTNSERDFGTAFLPRGAWSNVTEYSIGDLVSHDSGGDPYAFVSNEDGNINHEPQFDSGDVGISDQYWTVVQLVEAPGEPGEPGSSDVSGTSATNLAIGTGTKTFTIVENDRGWSVGSRLRASSRASPDVDWMEGIVTDYIGNTLELEVDLISGSGSHIDWNINIAGEPGRNDLNIRVITAAGAVAVAIDDEIILLNKTVGAATNINFPPAASYTGKGVSIKDIKGDAQTNNATPVFDGAETCDGLSGSNFLIDINYGDQGIFRPLPSGAGWYLHRR